MRLSLTTDGGEVLETWYIADEECERKEAIQAIENINISLYDNREQYLKIEDGSA